MPRKPKHEKTCIAVLADGSPVMVTLFPPAGAKSGYAYWPGLAYSRSTGRSRLNDAVAAAEAMVSNGSRPPALATAELSDPEFKRFSGNIFRESKTVRPRPAPKVFNGLPRSNFRIPRNCRGISDFCCVA